MEESASPDGVPGEVVKPLSEMAHSVRTRAGRLVKPVNRLIQNMTQSSKVKSFLSGSYEIFHLVSNMSSALLFAGGHLREWATFFCLSPSELGNKYVACR